MSLENILNPEGENDYSYEIQTPQQIFERSFAENSPQDPTAHSNKTEAPFEHIPNNTEALEHISKLLCYLEIDHAPSADSTASVLKDFADRLRAKTAAIPSSQH